MTVTLSAAGDVAAVQTSASGCCSKWHGNVMVDEQGKAKLLDFGIARLLDDSGRQSDHR